MATITHSNFNEALERVKAGKSYFFTYTAYRSTIIRDKDLKRWEKAGLPLVWPDKDGKGFRIASGRKSVYCLPGILCEAPEGSKVVSMSL